MKQMKINTQKKTVFAPIQNKTKQNKVTTKGRVQKHAKGENKK